MVSNHPWSKVVRILALALKSGESRNCVDRGVRNHIVARN